MNDNPVLNTASTQKRGILDTTLADILTNNKEAQSIVMKTMHISAEKLHEMVTIAEANPLMHTSIRKLFQNGTVQQAVSQQSDATQKNESFMEKVKNLFS